MVVQVIYDNCDNRTILHGKQDLELDLLKENTGVRQLSGGRKSIIEPTEGIEEAFLEVIKDHTAGYPMDETIMDKLISSNKLKDKGL